MTRLLSKLLTWFQQKIPPAPLALGSNAMELAEEEASERSLPVEQLTDALIAEGLKLRTRQPARWRTLTHRERQAALRAAKGFTNRQIAEAMGISQETVRSHIRHAKAKYGVTGRDALQAAILLELGDELIPPSHQAETE